MEVCIGEHMKIIKYDTEKYYFAKLISSLFNIDLVDLDSDEQKTNLTLGKDTFGGVMCGTLKRKVGNFTNNLRINSPL